MIDIRPAEAGHLAALQNIVAETGLFPPDLLPAMLGGALSGEDDSLWLVALLDGVPAGLCYAAPEEMADRVWNMLALGVRPGDQKTGLGAALVKRLETILRRRGERLLIVDTSGTPDFVGARAFYARQGYEEEARLRDFWAQGDDKVTFRKVL
jgi:ribosomal protein S18 acetylase RimI-like enzyme